MKKKWNQLTSLFLALVMVLSMALQVPMKAEAAEKNNLAGKVVSIMGDSISTFDGWIPVSDGYNLTHRFRYPDPDKKIKTILEGEVHKTWWYSLIYGTSGLNAKLGVNDSWAGSTITNTKTSNSGDLGPDAAMASETRIKNLGSKGTPDIILFYGGTNDMRRGYTVGDFSKVTNKPGVDSVDWSVKTWGSIVEAYAAALVRMQAQYPEAKILSILPTISSGQSGSNVAAFNTELKKVCDFYEVPYVDLYEKGIALSELEDGIHPGESGMARIKNFVYEELTTNPVFSFEDTSEHVVYPINQNLVSVSATLGHYKGIDAGKSFTEVLTPVLSDGEMTVSVTMGGTDITSTCYNKTTKTINIDSVTAPVTISAIGPSEFSTHIQQLPQNVTRETNLWTALTPELARYKDGTWIEDFYSITFPVKAGYQLVASSFGAKGTNGSEKYDGIRIAFLMENGEVDATTYSMNKVYTEFTNKGCVTVPSGAVAVNIPMWVNEENNSNEVKILNLPVIPDAPVILEKSGTLQNNGTYSIDLSAFTTGETTKQMVTNYTPLDVVIVLDASASMLNYEITKPFNTVTTKDKATEVNVQSMPAYADENTNLWNEYEHDSGYFGKDGNWVLKQGGVDIKSITIPVGAGDHIKARSFQGAGTEANQNGYAGTDGIRITYFDKNGAILNSVAPANVYGEYNTNGYVTVPEGAVAVNIPMWGEDVNNFVYLEDFSDNPTGKDRYNPENDADLTNMRIAILQKQVKNFANQLYNDAVKNDVDHRMSIITFGGGDKDTTPWEQGYFHKHSAVNGLTNSYIDDNGNYVEEGEHKDYYFTNTGLFVDGEFKNYNNPEDSTENRTGNAYLYTPVFADELVSTETYYYITSHPSSNKTSTYGGHGDVVAVQCVDGMWTADGGTTTVVPMSEPYESNSKVQFLARTKDEVPVPELGKEDYAKAMMSVAGENGMNESLVKAVDRIVAKGATYTQLGLQMACNVLDNIPERENEDAIGNSAKKIVILFTDGEPSHATEADVKGWADKIIASDAEFYTVCVEANKADVEWMQNIVAKPENYRYYDDIKYIGEFFDSITTEQITSKPAVSLNEDTVMQDILADGLKLPDNFEAADIEVSVVEVTNNGTYNDGIEYKYSPTNITSTDSNGVVTTQFSRKEVLAPVENLAVSYDKASGTICVKGFDYSEFYVTEDHPGYRLKVRINSIEATDTSVTNDLIDTNKSGSGLIHATSDSNIVFGFKSPVTKLISDVYVMDYAKPLTIENVPVGQKNVSHIQDDMQKFSQEEADVTTEVVDDYGTLTPNGDGTFTFIPRTMNWKDSADFYLFGQWDEENHEDAMTGVTTGNNLWSKVSVIPANSVYYEDDFVTNKSTGTVGIVYTGSWSEDGTKGNGTTSDAVTSTGNGATHGWEEALEGDVDYSDGSAHWVNYDKSNIAKVSFRFTGTGVDVYSRTNEETGKIVAMLYRVVENEDGEEVRARGVYKALVVDNLSKSGDYYQIPTLFFNNLEYGTYEVEISVGKANADETGEERLTYYLDGVRVYNPMSDDGEYTKKEQKAVFTSVREILLDNESFDAETTLVGQAGAVFIDEIPATEEDEADEIAATTKNVLGTYEEYGPKNEVYLKEGQAIVLKVEANGTYYLGLKNPTEPKKDDGTTEETVENEVVVEVTNGEDKREITINHSTDLYYKVIPNSKGYIVIRNANELSDDENASSVLLAVTKLRTTELGTSGVVDITPDVATAQVFALRRMVIVEDEEVETLPPESGENTDDSDLNVDVEIENPEQEKEDSYEEIMQAVQNFVKKLFVNINNWMKKINFKR